MTKVQRARLATLQALAADELTAAQKTELATLAALAATHTDPAKDTDAPAAAAAPAKPDPEQASAASASNAPTVRTVIAAAFNTLRSGNVVAADLATAQATIRTVTGERDQARNDLVTANASLGSLRSEIAARDSQLSTFASFLGLAATDLAGKDTAALQKLFGEKLALAAQEELATLGLPTGRLPKPTDSISGAAAGSIEELEAQAAAEKDPAKLGVIAAAIIKIRDAKVTGKN